MYSHDTMGLGHTRRNLLISQALANSGLRPTVLLITGASESASFLMHPRVDCLTLPAFRKSSSGAYYSRRLEVSLDELAGLRSSLIRTAIADFEPDVLIVDNVPRGAARELDATLDFVRHSGRTRCILGLRDILDEPAVVGLEWTRAANAETILAHYDAVWVYGDPAVYDPVREYAWSDDIARRVSFTGYLDQRQRVAFSSNDRLSLLDQLDLPPGQVVLCLVGSGQDGQRLAEAFAHAHFPPDTNGVILTGPHMPREAQLRLQALAASRSRLRVLEFVPEPCLLWEQADRVVAMGGYNTICEVLSYMKPALIVPRTAPRREQLIRAERLHDLGIVDVLHPDHLTPAALTDWLSRSAPHRSRAATQVDLNGLGRLPQLLEQVINASLLDRSAHGGMAVEIRHAAS